MLLGRFLQAVESLLGNVEEMALTGGRQTAQLAEQTSQVDGREPSHGVAEEIGRRVDGVGYGVERSFTRRQVLLNAGPVVAVLGAGLWQRLGSSAAHVGSPFFDKGKVARAVKDVVRTIDEEDEARVVAETHHVNVEQLDVAGGVVRHGKRLYGRDALGP